LAATTRDPEAPALAMVTGSELVTINRWQARAWEHGIAVAYHPDQPPAVDGWNPAGEHGAPVGYDLVLATPRTLSALGWCFFSTDRGVSDEIMRADHRPCRMSRLSSRSRSGRKCRSWWRTSSTLPGSRSYTPMWSWARPERPGWTGPQRQREVWLPLDAVTVAGMADRLIFGCHLLVRRSVSPTLRELGLNWQQMAPDGSCAVWGMTPAMLTCFSLPARPLGGIHACQVE
jgi:hypothetical protein